MEKETSNNVKLEQLKQVTYTSGLSEGRLSLTYEVVNSQKLPFFHLLTISLSNNS